jgi:hypothetical protein
MSQGAKTGHPLPLLSISYRLSTHWQKASPTLKLPSLCLYPMHSKVNVCFAQPSFQGAVRSSSKEMPVTRAHRRRRRIAGPSLRIVVFPAFCQSLRVAGQLQHLRVGVFPSVALAVMRSDEVRNGRETRPIAGGVLVFVPMSVECCQSGMNIVRVSSVGSLL